MLTCSEAFRIHDFDGDGKISRADLRAYLDVVYQRAVEDSVEPDVAEKHRQEVRMPDATLIARTTECD